jgi:hypothetical protein
MTEKGSGKAYNDRNVYILGAGFSAEAGLPVIRDFMNRMRDAAAWLEEQGDRKEEVTAIEGVLDFRLRAASASYRVPLDVENIEELFSLASASGSTAGWRRVKPCDLGIGAHRSTERGSATCFS